jgi:RNA polymerase sigma-70 factor (ECF subfamily)
MLGSLSESEDIVQDAYLRWHAAERDDVDNPRAYLSRTVTRLCLDHIKSARVRRETYVGPWLPEPIIDESALAPDTASELADDLSLALLMALERAAFLLHDVFEMEFGDIAKVLERGESACRQLAARGRAHVREARPRFREGNEATRLRTRFIAPSRPATRQIRSSRRTQSSFRRQRQAASRVIRSRSGQDRPLLKAWRRGSPRQAVHRIRDQWAPQSSYSIRMAQSGHRGARYHDGRVAAIYAVRSGQARTYLAGRNPGRR